jgi:hypothetical protein
MIGLVKSKQRVADHGEVFTPAWMVESMLDLVKESRTYPPMTSGDLAAQAQEAAENAESSVVKQHLSTTADGHGYQAKHDSPQQGGKR